MKFNSNEKRHVFARLGIGAIAALSLSFPAIALENADIENESTG